MRLVNQLESGTSSTVFTLPARTFASDFTRPREQVEHQIDEEIDVLRGGLRRILTRGFARDRVVVIEAPAGAPKVQTGPHHDRHDDGAREASQALL